MENTEHLCLSEKRKSLASELHDVESVLQQNLKEGEEKTQLLLKAANINFLLGHTRNCEQILKQVSFSSFDFREWIVENNQLVCGLQKAQNVVAAKEFGEIYCNLVQKIQGLPPMQEHIVEEMTIAYNCSLTLLWGAGHHTMSHHRSAAVLISGICRVSMVLLPSQQQKGDWIRYNGDELHKVFCPSTLTLVIDWMKKLLASLDDQEIMELSGLLNILVLSCFILAMLWMSKDQAKQAKELLLTVNNYLKNTNTKESRSLGNPEGERQTPRVFVVQGTGPLQYSFSSSRGQINAAEDLADITCFSLAFTHYLLEERDQAMEILLRKIPQQETTIKYLWLYLQGYLHFVNHEFSASMKCFQDAIKGCSLENYQKATALNMIGCCCAENNKPHTAIQKFKEALDCDICQLAPLYNIAIQYRKLANFEAEISSLKMLVNALQATCSDGLVDGTNGVCLRYSQMSEKNQDHHYGLAVSIPQAFLSMNHSPCCECSTETVMYSFGKRCLELDRFSEAADAYLDLLTVVLESDVLPSRLFGTFSSPSVLYQECAYSLLCDGRYEDAVTVCDRALHTFIGNKSSSQQRKGLQDIQNVCNNTKPSKKRLRESAPVRDGENERNCTNILPQDAILFMYKADALVQLGESVKALECLDRCLDTLDQQQLEIDTQEKQVDHSTEIIQSQKRQRIDDEGNVAILKKNETIKGFKVSRMTRAQAQAWNNKAIIVISLGHDAEALPMLYQALRCDPSHTEAVFNHTLLLWKLGKNTEGACNWLKFRGFDINMDKQTRNHSSFLSELRKCPLPETHGKINAAQLRHVDQLAVKYWCTGP